MMRMYRGIVCEKKNEYMVFLTKEGEFLRGIPIGPTPDVGQEADFHLIAVPSLRRKRMKPFFIAPVLVAAVLLVFMVASLFPKTSSALAYVQLEGETALELGVNQKGNVVLLRSLDEVPILNMDEWEGLPLAVVLDKAVSRMDPKAEELEVTTVYEKEEQADTKKIIEEAVRTVQAEHADRSWNVSESTVEERATANKNNQTIQQLRQTEKAPAAEEKKKPVTPNPPLDYENKINKQENNSEKNKEKQAPTKETNNNKQQSKEKPHEIKHQDKQEKQQEIKHQDKQEKQQEKWVEKKEKQEEKSQAKLEKAKEKSENKSDKNEKNKKDDNDNSENDEDNDDDGDD